jgi:hypothetical protein
LAPINMAFCRLEIKRLILLSLTRHLENKAACSRTLLLKRFAVIRERYGVMADSQY